MHEFHEKPIGFIQSKGETFQAKIGVCYDSAGDNDCFLNVTHKREPTKSLDEAKAQLEEASAMLHKIFPNPIPVNSDGMLWLSVIQAANPA
jgi:hypothetical protein